METGYIKGLDIVIETFKIMKKDIKNLQLFLVGSGTEDLLISLPGIHKKGYQNMANIYPKTSILLAPARYDAFPLVVPEAILCGVLPVISSRVGSQSLLKESPQPLIIDSLEPNHYAERISQLLLLSAAQRQECLNILQSKAKLLNQKTCIDQNKSAFKELTKEFL